MKRIYVDTNVFLDFVFHRDPFYEDAKRILALANDARKSVVFLFQYLSVAVMFFSSLCIAEVSISPEKRSRDLVNYAHHRALPSRFVPCLLSPRRAAEGAEGTRIT